jgi:hypothetical protein
VLTSGVSPRPNINRAVTDPQKLAATGLLRRRSEAAAGAGLQPQGLCRLGNGPWGGDATVRDAADVGGAPHAGLIAQRAGSVRNVLAHCGQGLY